MTRSLQLSAAAVFAAVPGVWSRHGSVANGSGLSECCEFLPATRALTRKGVTSSGHGQACASWPRR